MAVSLVEVVSGLALMFSAVFTYPRVLCSLLMDLVRCKMSIGCSVMDCSRTPTRFLYSIVLTLQVTISVKPLLANIASNLVMICRFDMLNVGRGRGQ